MVKPTYNINKFSDAINQSGHGTFCGRTVIQPAVNGNMNPSKQTTRCKNGEKTNGWAQIKNIKKANPEIPQKITCNCKLKIPKKVDTKDQQTLTDIFGEPNLKGWVCEREVLKYWYLHNCQFTSEC